MLRKLFLGVLVLLVVAAMLPQPALAKETNPDKDTNVGLFIAGKPYGTYEMRYVSSSTQTVVETFYSVQEDNVYQHKKLWTKYAVWIENDNVQYNEPYGTADRNGNEMFYNANNIVTLREPDGASVLTIRQCAFGYDEGQSYTVRCNVDVVSYVLLTKTAPGTWLVNVKRQWIIERVIVPAGLNHFAFELLLDSTETGWTIYGLK